MNNMSIKNISQNIFRNSPSKVQNNQTNPFGVSFKGNVLTADVFEKISNRTSNKNNLIEKVSNRSKMVTSAIVGSINDINSQISARLDSIVSFGRRLKENALSIRNQVAEGWNKADAWWESVRTREVVDVIKENWAKIKSNEVDTLVKLPVTELQDMLQNEIALIK